MLRFMVLIVGEWHEIDQATILQDGRRLRWTREGLTGIAQMSEWRLHESTKNSLWFKTACWNALNGEEQALAIARRPSLSRSAA